MVKLILHCLIFTLNAVTVHSFTCKSNQYKNSQTRECLNCTVCQADFFPLHACKEFNDTYCFPIFKVKFGDVVLDSKSSEPSTDIQEYKSDTEQWKNMAYTLIGVLCFLAIVASVIVLFSCHQYCQVRRAKLANSNNRTGLQEIESVDGEYVVIHRRPGGYIPLSQDVNDTHDTQVAQLQQIMESSTNNSDQLETSRFEHRSLRHNRAYRPQRRLMNEYTDDVFESEDSSGSKITQRGPLHTIHETPDMETETNSVSSEQTHFRLDSNGIIPRH